MTRRLGHAIAIGVIAALIAAGGAVPAVADVPTAAGVPAATSSFTAPVTRLGGSTRYDTSVAISRATFSPGVDVAFLASGADYPDALSGSAVAARLGGPVLLTAPTALPAVVGAELTRLAPRRIIVLGGAGAVSDAVSARLAAYTKGSVTRAAGDDRYGTSVAISTAAFPKTAPVVFVASGADFPDALSSATAAGTLGGPVLLTRPTALPDAIAAELARLKPARVVIVGGEGAVSASVAAAVRTATKRTPERAAGRDRYATSAAVADLVFSDAPVAHLASGTTFADALGGAVAAVAAGGPLLLTQPTALPASVGGALTRLGVASAVILGGTGAVSAGVASLVGDAGTTRRTAASGVLTAATQVKAGKCLAATTGTTKLCVTTKGALEVRDGTDIVWTSGTTSAQTGALRLRANGDLTLFSTTGAVIWRAYTTGSGASTLRVLGTGDVRLSTASGTVTWATMTGTDSPVWGLPFAAGQKWSAGGPHASSGSNETRQSLDFGVSSSSKASRKVVTVAAGTVFKITCGANFYLGVRHGGGWESGYYHLVNLKADLIGKTVPAGTYIGDVGRALPCGGGATFDHVHLTIRYNGSPVSVEGMTFGGYTIRNTGDPFSGRYTDAAGKLALTATGGANCCLLAPPTDK